MTANKSLQRTPRRALGLFDNVWPAPRPARAESLSLGRQATSHIMETSVHFSSKTEHVSAEVQSDPAHQVRASIDASGDHVLFECSSRLALYEFGRSLMHEALFGGREIEFFPLVTDGKALVVNGVRLTEDSARVFVHFPQEGRNVA